MRAKLSELDARLHYFSDMLSHYVMWFLHGHLSSLLNNVLREMKSGHTKTSKLCSQKQCPIKIQTHKFSCHLKQERLAHKI